MRSRRGLHTIVGAVIFTAVMISALSYVSYSLDLLGNFSETVIVEDSRQRDKDSESFQISSVKMTSANKLNATIVNTGNIPLTLSTLWVDDTSAANDVKKFTIGKTIAPGGKLSVGSDLSFTMDPTKGYDVKLVTKRGNTESIFVNSAAQAPLYIQAHTIPETVSTEFDTVVLMSVTNNATNAATLFNLQPTSTPTIDTSSCTPNCSATYVSGPDPASYPVLKPGDTATFKWIYEVAGADSNKITFTTGLNNGIGGNTANTDVYVRDVVSALESGTAIASKGVAANALNNNIMMFHQETTQTPSSSYQMLAASPDGGNNGIKLDLETNPKGFYTQNHTAAITIPPGNWITSLRLQSEALPTSLKGEGESMIFHFNANEVNPDNSEGSANRDLESCPSAGPTFASALGPHSSGTYRFDGAKCFRSLNTVSSGDANHINTVPDTTALWFKTAATVGSTAQHLVSWSGGSTVGYDTSTSQTFTTTPYSFSFTVASNSNRMLVVTTSGEAGTPATNTCRVTGVTYNGQALTLAVERNFDDSGTAACSSIWYRANPASGSNTLAVTTAGTTTDLNVGAISLYNVVQSAPEATASGQNTGQNSITTNISTLTNNAWVIDSAHSGNAGAFTAGSGQTQRYTQNGGTSAHTASTKQVSPAGSTSMQETQSGANRLAHTVAVFAPVTTSITDYYRINLEASTGKVVFNFKHTSGSGTTCKSTNRYDDGNWYHVVAVRESTNNNCSMYITKLDGTDAESPITSSVGGSSGTIVISGKWYVGSNATGNGNFFNGWVDDIIHWNGKALTNNPEADDLSHTNYGVAAHKLVLQVNKTDQNGVLVSNVINKTVNVPFYDPKGTDDNTDSTYGVLNYTSVVGTTNVAINERIKFGTKYVVSNSTWNPLELDMKVDDQNMSPWPSFLQIPTPDIPFPSYFVYDNDNRLAVNVFNIGPYGSWFVYQGTRAVFDSPTFGTSYAALICSVNSTESDPCSTAGANSAWRVTEDRDSIFIPVNNVGRVYFWSVQDRPDRDLSGGTVIPPGQYDMYVFIDGYDERGEKFLRNLQLGRVTVVE